MVCTPLRLVLLLRKGALTLFSEGRGACGVCGDVAAQGRLHRGLVGGREVGDGPF
jgi:hypothetical protein